MSKKKRKKEKHKSYLVRVLSHKDKYSPAVTYVGIFFAIILDVLTILKNLLISLILICIISATIFGFIAWSKVEPYYKEYNEFAENIVNNSSYDDFKLTESSYIYDNKGDVITKLKANMDSDYLTYKNIPNEFIDAFVAIEDRTFWDNPGIDIKGIIRVIKNYVDTNGEEEHGASTITQQLVRNIYLTHEVSIERKLKEILISLKITKKYTKEDIIEFYCNDICFANAFYGIQAASKGYFNKNCDELSLSQIAYLCAIPNSPEYYNPYKNPERALERRNKILKDMLSMNLITESDYNKAIDEKIIIEKPTYELNDYMATYAIDCATTYLMEQNGFKTEHRFRDMDDYENYQQQYEEKYEEAKNKLYTGGYRIYTSLDKNIQSNLQSILDENLSFDEEIDEATGIYSLQGAITVYDNERGKVVAVIGGRSQDSDSQTYSLNRAFQAYRQPGSSIKPLVVYTPALMNGYTPNTTVYNIDVTQAKQKGVDVQSLTGESMTLKSALERSKNGVAWQIFDKLGSDLCMSFINKMDFNKICPDDYYNASSLGGLTYGVTTVEMAGAYATLENHGEYRKATCIESILDKDGNEIYIEDKTETVYSAKAADQVVDMMKGVLKNGTAAKLNWYKETDTVAACKTGTTNNSKDGWLCGFTPYYTVTVWVGYDKPKELSNLYGATYPGQIWKQSMLSLIENKIAVTDFEKSDYYDDTYTESTVEILDDLPDYAYELYMPGRDNSELVSDGYTVYQFRKDRVTGESVEAIINTINNLQYGDEQIGLLYNQGCDIINTIYSISYTSELQMRLNDAYNSKQLNIQ